MASLNTPRPLTADEQKIFQDTMDDALDKLYEALEIVSQTMDKRLAAASAVQALAAIIQMDMIVFPTWTDARKKIARLKEERQAEYILATLKS